VKGKFLLTTSAFSVGCDQEKGLLNGLPDVVPCLFKVARRTG
jgi:hypothetical protein